jgi:hypothetical protein
MAKLNGHAKNVKTPSPPPPSLRRIPSSRTAADEQTGQDGRLGRSKKAHERVCVFLKDYFVLSDRLISIIAAWVLASWMSEHWDRFPLLAITSPEPRCGKTTLLELLQAITRQGMHVTNVTAAAVYRLITIKKGKLTFLMDESQSLKRQGSEQSQVVRELLNASIDNGIQAIRCSGERYEDVGRFSLYCPKVYAMIGHPDGILLDRSLPIGVARKSKSDVVNRYRSRDIRHEGETIQKELAKWAKTNWERAVAIYDKLDLLDIANDRMADLLLPLQAVLTLEDNHKALTELVQYANSLEEVAQRQENRTDGVKLLAAIKAIFDKCQKDFIETTEVIQRLLLREEENWSACNKGKPLNAHHLAYLLRDYDIQPCHSDDKKTRGYRRAAFVPVWSKYVSCGEASQASAPSQPSGDNGRAKP